jgi:hypothetical protein
MSDTREPAQRLDSVPAAVAVACVVILLGGLGMVPYLLKRQPTLATVVSTPRVNTLLNRGVSAFPVGAHQQACMSAVTVTHQSAVAGYELRAEGGARGVPPLELLISAPGYHATSELPGGEYEKHLQFLIRPPRHSVIASACLLDRGTVPVAVEGTTDPATLSRSVLSIDGRPVAGNLTLNFFEDREQTRLAGVSEAFERISILTDHLIPVWLVWIVALATLVGVPMGTLYAVRRAIMESSAAH